MMDLRWIGLAVCLCKMASVSCEVAKADVVYSTPQTGVENRLIDIDQNGEFDFSLQNLVNLGIPGGVTYSLSLQVPRDSLNSGLARDQYGILLQLSAGETIGPVPTAPRQWLEQGRGGWIAVTGDDFPWSEPWATQPVGMLGLRFQREDELHYGWIRLNLTGGTEPLPNGNGQLVYQFKVLDFAYETTPNTPIVAGAVPEPASVVLGLIGIACIAALLRRRLFNGAILILVLFLSAPIAARADRLEPVWIGPDGNGGPGAWHTPSNWNLGVVPNNGADGNGDGVPDIFDARIDGGKAARSSVLGGSTRTEIANLSVDAGDILEISHPLGFVLSDSDSGSEIQNNGLLRVGSVGAFGVPSLLFVGDELQLTGNGTLQLSLAAGQPAHLVGLTLGSRITNGRGHTIRTTGNTSSRIGGYASGSVNGNVAFTNDGNVVAEDRAIFFLRLNQDDHWNQGAMRAVSRARMIFSSDLHGTLHNRGTIEAEGGSAEVTIHDMNLVNHEDGVLRASSDAAIRIDSTTSGSQPINRGLIEATGHNSRINLWGRNILNEGQGVVRASNGGGINLFEGVFRLDDSYQLADSLSHLVLGHNAILENAGRVLSPGPGTLVLADARIRGGEVSSGGGHIEFRGFPLLEDITLTGTAIGLGFAIKGSLTVASKATFEEPMRVYVSGGDAVLRGPGLAQFEAGAYLNARRYTLRIAPEHIAEFSYLSLVEGTLLNHGMLRSEDSIDVSEQATLGGAGTIVASAIFIGGNLSPGEGIGTLTVIGDIGFGQSSRFLVELGTDGADLLRLTGNLGLDTIESLNLTGGVVGQSYVIAQYGNELHGVFDNVTPGYDVTYDNVVKQIRVTPIPEPGGLVLVIVGLLVGGWALARRNIWRKPLIGD